MSNKLDFSTELIGRRALAGASRIESRRHLNISSGAATMAVGAVAHYGAAKAALNSYSRSLAIASDRGKWMTGGIINVDGGMSAR
jgi:NAD(P)-dependent dehydrogenase (short-subunit alcohol dehydrogenase family)